MEDLLIRLMREEWDAKIQRLKENLKLNSNINIDGLTVYRKEDKPSGESTAYTVDEFDPRGGVTLKCDGNPEEVINVNPKDLEDNYEIR